MKLLYRSTTLAFVILLSLNISAQDLSSAEKTAVRQVARSMGTWTGGGGEGVICFKSTWAKTMAFDSKGRLRKQVHSQIGSVYAYDLIEFRNDLAIVPSEPGETPVQYLHRVIARNVEPSSPYFARRIREAIAMIVAPDGSLLWEDQGSLMKLADAGERRIRIVSPECVITQVVIRYSKNVEGPFPQFFIDYNKYLFDLMAQNGEPVIHQAALILHEALYLAGYSLGVLTSSGIRGLVAHIMWKDLPWWLDAEGENFRQGLFITILYTYGMRDAMRLFLDESQERPPFSKQSRQWSRAELARKYREAWDLLIAQDKAYANCLSGYFAECDIRFLPVLANHLSPEEAFLFVAASVGNEGQIKFTIDRFLLEEADDDQEARLVCKIFQKDRGRYPEWTDLIDKALSYCLSWGKL